MGKRESCETSQLWSTEHKRTNAKATLMYYFKNECEGFIWVSKHEKALVECFNFVGVFGNPDETQCTSLRNNFSVTPQE